MTSLMIVDDEYLIRYSLQILLEQEGFSATTASSGQEALGTLNERTIDAIILDIDLPDVNGLDLLKTIREQHPSVMVIMITGDPNEQGRTKARGLGARGYIEKPFDLERLKDLIEPPCSEVTIYRGICNEIDPHEQDMGVSTRLHRHSPAAAPQRETIH